MMTYNKYDDELMQAHNSQTLQGPQPVWYLPIKNKDSDELQKALSQLNKKDLKSALSWDGSGQWSWQIRTALGYAIWRGDKEAVKILIGYGVDVKEDVCQEQSSEVRFDGGMRWSSLAYCVECRRPEIIPDLHKVGATKADWNPGELFNLEGSSLEEMIDSFWSSGGVEVSKALDQAESKNGPRKKSRASKNKKRK